jgi:Fur family transcriptional regulator, ferric uptake regulator
LVVEVVRHSPGELVDRLEPARTLELLLEEVRLVLEANALLSPETLCAARADDPQQRGTLEGAYEGNGCKQICHGGNFVPIGTKSDGLDTDGELKAGLTRPPILGVVDWVGHARATLERDGYRVSAPRSAVVECLADLGCSVTAREIADNLRERGNDVGVASIYRTLDLLHNLRLARRVDMAEGVARYEPIDPSGEHHHHLVCQSCGDVTAFEDRDLERAIAILSERVDYAVDAHDVTLRGECPACRAAGA